MKAIILAAGMGKRMQSDLQKVMHPILGKPIVRYVVEAAKDAVDITVVVGKDGQEIKDGLSDIEGLFFAVQDEPLGTGHAVLAGSGRIKEDDDVLVLCGDMPLVTSEFIKEIMEFSKKNNADAVVAAVYREDVGDFGRVYDTDGYFFEIVEARDITEKHGKTTWANTGIYLFKGAPLLRGLSKMKNDNNQNEFYLTDVPKILKDEGMDVRVFHTREDMSVFTGINTQAHLAEAVGHMRSRINARHMANGVRMINPDSVYIENSVKISRGAVLLPGVILEGNCEISENAVIGPYSHMKDTIVGKNANVKHSVTDGAKIGAGTNVGPFAYLRPGAEIGENCRIGNFVEVKNATIGDKTAMAHLAYIGDADVGSNVNFSCGAITANYDGKNKHRTTIGNNAFIGSNANLVAPVDVGENSKIAAGSTITDDVPPNALGIARERQTVKHNRYGFSYIEIIIALSIFALLLMAAIPLTSQAARNLAFAQDAYNAHLAAQGIMLSVRSEPEMLAETAAFNSAAQFGVTHYSVWSFTNDNVTSFSSPNAPGIDITLDGISSMPFPENSTVVVVAVWDDDMIFSGRAVGVRVV